MPWLRAMYDWNRSHERSIAALYFSDSHLLISNCIFFLCLILCVIELAFCLVLRYVCFMFNENFDRITQNPAVMGGKPCIRGMRVTVGMIIGQIGEGVSYEKLLSDYPYLEKEDIMQALRYAAAISQWREITLAEV